jgi:hypothetical protein
MSIFSVPSNFTAPIQFTVALDGIQHTITVYYQYYAARLYFKVTDSSGTIVVVRPLISSENNIDNLSHYFTNKMYYSEVNQIVTIL